MNKLLLVTCIALGGFSGVAMGAVPSCSCGTGTQLTNSALSGALSGNTVCVSNGSGWEWQEQHRAGGQLWDYKLGTNPADPTEQVGTWSTTNGGPNSTVTHTYGASSYTYKVYRQAGNYCFCDASNAIQATIKTGTASGCP